MLGDDYTAASTVVKDNSKPQPTPYFLSSKLTSLFTKTSSAPISPMKDRDENEHYWGNDVNSSMDRRPIDPNSPYDKASRILFDDDGEERDQILFTDTFLRTGNLPPYPTNLSTNLKTQIDSAKKHTLAATTMLAEGTSADGDHSVLDNEADIDGSSSVMSEQSSVQVQAQQSIEPTSTVPMPVSAPASSSVLDTPITKEYIPRKGVPPLSQGNLIPYASMFVFSRNLTSLVFTNV